MSRRSAPMNTDEKQLPEGWKWKKLGDVCEVQRGLTYSGKDTVDISNQVVLRATNIDLGSGNLIFDELKYLREDLEVKPIYSLRKNSLLVCFSSGSKSHLGKIAIVNDNYPNFYFGGFIGQITPTKSINSMYLFYCLLSESYKKYISSLTDGVNINNLKASELKAFPIPLPPLTEQKRIVAILDEIFAAIDKAKANVEKNLANAKELFESYLNGIFTNPGEDWGEKKLGEVCEFVRGPFGGSLKKSIFKPNGYAVYEQQHAINDQFEYIRYFIDEKKFNEMKRFELKSGDLIMSCSGTMGRTAIVPDNLHKGIINQALLKLTTKNNLSVRFLKLWMASNDFLKQIAIHSQGAAIKNVSSVKTLKKIKLKLPSKKTQSELIKKAYYFSEESLKLKEIYNDKISALEELKKSILKQAFEGKL